MGLFVGNVWRGIVGAVALSCPLSPGHVEAGRNLNLTSTTSTTQATSSRGRQGPVEHVLTSVLCLNKMWLWGVWNTFKVVFHLKGQYVSTKEKKKKKFKKFLLNDLNSVWTDTHAHLSDVGVTSDNFFKLFKTINPTIRYPHPLHATIIQGRGEKVSSGCFLFLHTTTSVTFCLYTVNAFQERPSESVCHYWHLNYYSASPLLVWQNPELAGFVFHPRVRPFGSAINTFVLRRVWMTWSKDSLVSSIPQTLLFVVFSHADTVVLVLLSKVLRFLLLYQYNGILFNILKALNNHKNQLQIFPETMSQLLWIIHQPWKSLWKVLTLCYVDVMGTFLLKGDVTVEFP